MGAPSVLRWNVHETKRNRPHFSTCDDPHPLWNWLAYILSLASAYTHFAFNLTLGILLTVIGLASILVPLVSPIATLLASSYFLTQSRPGLQFHLHRIPFLGGWLKYLDGTRIMSRKVQSRFAIYLWGNLVVTLACLYGIDRASYPIVSINIFCCLVSTAFLFKFRAEPVKISHVKEAVGGDPAFHLALRTHQLNAGQPQLDVLDCSLLERYPGATTAWPMSTGLPHSAPLADHLTH